MAAGHETRDFTQVFRDLFRREHASRCRIQGCYFGEADRCAYCDQLKPPDAPPLASGAGVQPAPVDPAAAEFLPSHKCSLTLEHNPHKVLYRTVAQWLEEVDVEPGLTWPSPQERQRALDTNEVWVLTWYPNTPIAFQWVAATTLDGVLACARTALPPR